MTAPSEYAVPVDEAMDILDVIPDYDAGHGPGPCVHSLVEASFGFLGAHWYLPDVRAAMEKWGVQKSGARASGSGHGLVVIKDGTPVFFATRPSPSTPEGKAT